MSERKRGPEQLLPQPRLFHVTNAMHNTLTTKGISIINDKQNNCIIKTKQLN